MDDNTISWTLWGPANIVIIYIQPFFHDPLTTTSNEETFLEVDGENVHGKVHSCLFTAHYKELGNIASRL